MKFGLSVKTVFTTFITLYWRFYILFEAWFQCQWRQKYIRKWIPLCFMAKQTHYISGKRRWAIMSFNLCLNYFFNEKCLLCICIWYAAWARCPFTLLYRCIYQSKQSHDDMCTSNSGPVGLWPRGGSGLKPAWAKGYEVICLKLQLNPMKEESVWGREREKEGHLEEKEGGEGGQNGLRTGAGMGRRKGSLELGLSCLAEERIWHRD